MYPDSLFNSTWYLIPERGMSYDDKRATFNRMLDEVGRLTSDIGYADMLLQFDNIENLQMAKIELSYAKIKWQERGQ